MPTMRQTELASGASRTVCWLPLDSRVRVGSVISFPGFPERWQVMWQGEAVTQEEFRRTWKVGGL